MTCHVPRLLLAAPASGSGKTTLTCALLRVLERRGLSPCAFKCGPDYIDPMFHRSVLGLPSRNLDLFFSSPDEVRRNLALGAQGRGAAIIEGVMGYYDGVGGGERASRDLPGSVSPARWQGCFSMGPLLPWLPSSARTSSGKPGCPC